MDKQQTITMIFVCISVIAIIYIITEKVDFYETAKNESYSLGYSEGNEVGFNQGYFNGSIDYLIALNQNKVFPCLDFSTGEYEQKDIGGLCEND